jgi:hypothetical protein
VWRRVRETAVFSLAFGIVLAWHCHARWGGLFEPAPGELGGLLWAAALGLVAGLSWASCRRDQDKEAWAEERRQLQQDAWDARSEGFGAGRRRDA